MKHRIVKADVLDFLRAQKPRSLDLVFGSPPYEKARLYLEGGRNLGIARDTHEWVRWMVEVYQAAQKARKGLVAFVVAGQTRGFEWSAAPALLMAELDRAGMNLRNPPIFKRVGIPGSGGPDWLRADYEWIVCTSRRGELPWSDNTAMGHTPKWAPGGAMSNRHADGQRINAQLSRRRANKWGSASGCAARRKDGSRDPKVKPSHQLGTVTRGSVNGDTQTSKGSYDPPAKANPGNVIHVEVGGGIMGDPLCHENEAPFPEKLAEFFVRSFCPPGGVVCDPFLGSGTTAAVAKRFGRSFIGCDLRQSQVELARRRLRKLGPLEAQP